MLKAHDLRWVAVTPRKVFGRFSKLLVRPDPLVVVHPNMEPNSTYLIDLPSWLAKPVNFGSLPLVLHPLMVTFGVVCTSHIL